MSQASLITPRAFGGSDSGRGPGTRSRAHRPAGRESPPSSCREGCHTFRQSPTHAIFQLHGRDLFLLGLSWRSPAGVLAGLPAWSQRRVEQGGRGLAKYLPSLGWRCVPYQTACHLVGILWLQHVVAATLFSGQGSTSTMESILRKSLQHFPLPGPGTTRNLWVWATPGLQKPEMGDQ